MLEQQKQYVHIARGGSDYMHIHIQEPKEFRNMCQISLELELKVVISCHVGARNQTWILYKSRVSS